MTTIRSVMTREPRTVSATESVGEVLGIFRDEHIRHLPVVDAGGRLAGIVSDRDVRAWRQAWQDVEEGEGSTIAAAALALPIAQLMTPEVETVAPNAPLGPVAADMANRRIGAMVVVDGARVIGIVTATDLLGLLEGIERPVAGLVADRMTSTVYSVTPRDGLDAALMLMLEYGIRHVPVVDDEGAVVGVVSHRDVLAEGTMRELVDEEGAVGARARSLRDVLVADVMNVAETTTPDTPLAEAAQVLLDTGYGCLPVVENRRLVGILTEADFVRHVAEGGSV